MNTTKRLIEQLEKLTNKKVVLKENRTIGVDEVVEQILDLAYDLNSMGEFEVKGEKISIMAVDGGPSAVVNISELKREVAKLTPEQIEGIMQNNFGDYFDEMMEKAVITSLDDYM